MSQVKLVSPTGRIVTVSKSVFDKTKKDIFAAGYIKQGTKVKPQQIQLIFIKNKFGRVIPVTEKAYASNPANYLGYTELNQGEIEAFLGLSPSDTIEITPEVAPEVAPEVKRSKANRSKAAK